jgi:hypothetical protein
MNDFTTYEMADGSQVWGEYSFVTELEFFEDRDSEIKLIKKTYRLLTTEEITLPDPFPGELEGEDGDE